MPDLHEWKPVVMVTDDVDSLILRKILRLRWFWCVSLPHNWQCVGGRHRGAPPFHFAERQGFARTEVKARAGAERAARELLARPRSDFVRVTDGGGQPDA